MFNQNPLMVGGETATKFSQLVMGVSNFLRGIESKRKKVPPCITPESMGSSGHQFLIPIHIDLARFSEILSNQNFIPNNRTTGFQLGLGLASTIIFS